MTSNSDQNKTLTYSSVDWLTVTTKTERETARMLAQVASFAGAKIAQNIKLRPWQFMGYHGKSISGLRYGLRGSEGIAVITGASAQQLWREVAPVRSKCTRIDLAVTVKLESPNEYVALKAYEAAEELGNIKSSLIVNSEGGSTCYIGSRTSRFFGRLYDKGAEENQEKGTLWRYEVECKKPASDAIVTQLLEQDYPNQWIGGYVCDWFTCRGIIPLFHSTSTHNAIEISASTRDHEKTLLWLSTQVKPAVGRLIIGGLEDEVREALGLPFQTNFFPIMEP